MIAVVDYGAGNLRSIRRALEFAGADVVVTSDPDVVAAADAVVLPGVGAAGHAMKVLDSLGLTGVLKDIGHSGKPLLGICLGMQLLYRDQDEGASEGLGLLPGRIRKIEADVKVPHIGWNRSRVTRDGPLGRAGDEVYYYFVHSYVAEPDDPADAAALTEYGEIFPSVVVRGNVWGTQFHPELSSRDGLALVRAFVESAGEGGRLDAAAAVEVGAA